MFYGRDTKCVASESFSKQAKFCYTLSHSFTHPIMHSDTLSPMKRICSIIPSLTNPLTLSQSFTQTLKHSLNYTQVIFLLCNILKPSLRHSLTNRFHSHYYLLVHSPTGSKNSSLLNSIAHWSCKTIQASLHHLIVNSLTHRCTDSVIKRTYWSVHPHRHSLLNTLTQSSTKRTKPDTFSLMLAITHLLYHTLNQPLNHSDNE